MVQPIYNNSYVEIIKPIITLRKNNLRENNTDIGIHYSLTDFQIIKRKVKYP